MTFNSNGHNEKLSIKLDTRREWRCVSNNNRTVHFFGFIDGVSKREFGNVLLWQSMPKLLTFLKTSTGHFMFLVIDADFVFAATDAAGSCQLLWSKIGKKLYISDNISTLIEQLNLSNSDVDKDMALAFSMSGYTVGDQTLYSGVKTLIPGHYLYLDQHRFDVAAYYKWLPTEPKNPSNNYVEQLSDLNNLIIKRLINRADGRKIVVPLSAGCDSRFIASGLAHHKYDNVLCVSYGKKGNRETHIAKEVSSRLGYKHLELIYTRQLIRQTWHSNEYNDYKDFCDTGTSVHFFGEYPLLKWLHNNGEIDSTAIFSNGQSGDFISGNHIDSAFLNPTLDSSSDLARLQKITTVLVRKHYGLWMTLSTKENLHKLDSILSKQIMGLEGLSKQPCNDFGVYEAIEFINRQSKYVLNGLKTYEYFGHQWSVPLWDRDYMDFWANVPLKLKTQQQLYKETLIKQNWGDVWRDIEINPPARTSRAFQGIRILLKAPFLFIGKKKWHEFDRHYLDVFLTPTIGYAMKNYREIWADKRIHRNPISFYVEEYLNNKRLSWDGKKWQ
jgi:asparagine synthase (glutamine-hydrolysing)